MEKKEQLYEGKSKVIYATDDPNLVIQYFKDDASAFNGIKKGSIVDKGIINNHVSTAIFKFLEGQGIKTHLVEEISDREVVTKKLEIIPVEVVMRNVVAGSLAKRTGLQEGQKLNNAILEFYYKSDELGDPMINDYHIKEFGWATEEEIAVLKEQGFRINQLLFDYFKERKIRLVDFKLEFGRHQGEVLLGDEISPDGCRLWNWDTDEKMDKDRFRFDLGGVKEKYEEVYHLICG